MNDVDYMALDTQEVMSLFYSIIIDDAVSTGASRHEVRQAVDQKLEEIVFQEQSRAYRAAKAEADAAGKPVYVAKPEPAPFVLTPEMQASFGLTPTQSPAKPQ
jgi:hypothetical protein